MKSIFIILFLPLILSCSPQDKEPPTPVNSIDNLTEEVTDEETPISENDTPTESTPTPVNSIDNLTEEVTDEETLISENDTPTETTSSSTELKSTPNNDLHTVVTNEEYSFQMINSSILGFYNGSADFDGWFSSATEYNLEIASGVNTEGNDEVILLFSRDDNDQFCAYYTNPLVEAYETSFYTINSSQTTHGGIGKVNFIENIIFSKDEGLDEIILNRFIILDNSTQPNRLSTSSPRSYSTLKSECLSLGPEVTHSS